MHMVQLIPLPSSVASSKSRLVKPFWCRLTQFVLVNRPLNGYLVYYYAVFRTGEKLPELLSNCDYVCNVLPSTPSTDGLLDGDVLSHCRHKVLASSVSFI